MQCIKLLSLHKQTNNNTNHKNRLHYVNSTFNILHGCVAYHCVNIYRQSKRQILTTSIHKPNTGNFMKNFIDWVNLPKHISNHVCGANHSLNHRRIVGFIVFMVGYALTHAGGGIMFLQIITDNVGLYLHAAGLIPFIEPREN